MSTRTKVVRLPLALAERLLTLSPEERALAVERGLAEVVAPALAEPSAGGSPTLHGETWRVYPLVAAEWADVMDAAAAETKMQRPFTSWGDNHFRGWAQLLRREQRILQKSSRV